MSDLLVRDRRGTFGARRASGAAFAGLGTALPATAVGNDVVGERIGKDSDWIVQRTGIRSRRVLEPGAKLAPLAAEAAEAALEDAGLTAADVDLVLVATASADDVIPALAPEVSGLIGSGRAGAYDLGAACTGFLAGIQMGGGLLEAGRAEAVLVIGAERLSHFTDQHDKRTAMLFADAAGAAVLTRTDGPGEIGPVVMRSEAQRDLLYAEHGGLIQMDGHEVFKHAVSRMTEVTQEALSAAGATLEDIDLFVYHQANARIVKSVGQRLGLDPARVVDSIEEVGNVSAASIPLALANARDDGRLADGTRVLLAAFGAGFVWGATVLDWRVTA